MSDQKWDEKICVSRDPKSFSVERMKLFKKMGKNRKFHGCYKKESSQTKWNVHFLTLSWNTVLCSTFIGPHLHTSILNQCYRPSISCYLKFHTIDKVHKTSDSELFFLLSKMLNNGLSPKTINLSLTNLHLNC